MEAVQIPQGIYEKIVPQYPAASPDLPFCSVCTVEQGIYGKIVRQYPADGKKVDLERQFFCIYPDMRKKICFSAPRDSGQGTGKVFFYRYPGLCLEQNIPDTSVGKRTLLIISTGREYSRIGPDPFGAGDKIKEISVKYRY